MRERVLLTLPVGRSPPRGAIVEAVVRVTEPRPAANGFDERAWLARQGIHVVVRASSWRQIARRGGVLGLGDRLRDRIEAAVGRGTSGVRRALVLGVVLGEDEGLPTEVRQDFRASGLAHLLAVSGQNVAYITFGVLGLGWLLRLSRVVRELLALTAIAAYVLAVGWQPSVVRAGVAGALASLAWLAARPDYAPSRDELIAPAPEPQVRSATPAAQIAPAPASLPARATAPAPATTPVKSQSPASAGAEAPGKPRDDVAAVSRKAAAVPIGTLM